MPKRTAHKTVKIKRVPKPWGYELWYAQTRRYVGKILVINRGHRLSRQYHRVKHETIYILKGRMRLELGGRTRMLGPGNAVTIPPRTIHRFAAPTDRVTALEVSTPEVHDVVRLEDDYKRLRSTR